MNDSMPERETTATTGTPEPCAVWWCDQREHTTREAGAVRTTLHQHQVGSEGVRLLQCENEPGPWSKVTVDLDLGEADDATTLRHIAHDLIAAAMLVERIERSQTDR
jgi:hypothetical protein